MPPMCCNTGSTATASSSCASSTRANPAIDVGRFRLPARGFDALAGAARDEGFRFLDRLAREWASGANRFDRPGEVPLGAFEDGRLVAVCGLNRDPYAGDPAVARLRHLYVLPGCRGGCIASRLLRAIIAGAHSPFRRVRLRSTAGAAGFYERLGFVPVAEPEATHALSLPERISAPVQNRQTSGT